MIRLVPAVGLLLFGVSTGSTKSPGLAATFNVRKRAAATDPPEAHGAAPGSEESTGPTGVRHGIDWGTLDVTKWREHTADTGLKFREYDVQLAGSMDVIQVLCAEEAAKQADKFKFKEDGKTPLGLEITYNCVSHVFDARGIRCKGEDGIRDFWIANSAFAKLVHHNCVEEPDDRKAKEALLAGKRVLIVYKSVDGVMQHIAVMKTMDVPFGVATSDSTCDSKPGAYALERGAHIDSIKRYFSQTLLSSFYIEK